MALLSALATEIAIPVCAVIGIAFSLVQWRLSSCNSDNRNREEQDSTRRIVKDKWAEIRDNVFEGVKSFLSKEYRYVGAFMAAFVILIFLLLGSVESFSTQSRPCKFDPSKTCKPALFTAVFSTVSFLLGAFASVLSRFLGTKIAIYANARTALEERNFDGRNSIAAFRSGVVMGILNAAIGLLMLYLAINLFKLYYGNDWEGLFEAITGYGLGGASMALFGRTGGGIYAKAADVCVHLVKKIEPRSPQTDRNPAVITNYVGGIVGDIAGMGPVLFGSYADSSCAALVVASISSFGTERNFTAMCYPLLISSVDILVCLITPLVGEIKPALKKQQLIVSTILMTVGSLGVSRIALPSSFTIYNFEKPKDVKSWQLFLCVAVGLWAGLIIRLVKNIKTASRRLRSVAAQNVSIALGSVSIPTFAAVCIYVSSHFAATYGIAVAALGMLSTISTRLAMDACGPISDNAGRIAQMAGVRGRNAAGNTTVAIGKGFAIESAALVSIALFGAFVTRPAMSSPVDVLTLKITIGLIMGAWLPYYFSAMTMKIVGRAGLETALKIREQLGDRPELIEVHNKPARATCFKILTDASFSWMFQPGAVVMFTPLIVGTVFGVEMLSGILAGSLGSVVQIAISTSNSDRAWSQANEDIRAGALEFVKERRQHLERRPEDEEIRRRLPEYDEIRDIVDGKTIADSRKDTSGPPLNILVQLMAVESLVFAPFFARYGGLLFKILGGREWTTSFL